MFFLSPPFISDFLLDTAIENKIPVVTDLSLLSTHPKLQQAHRMGLVKSNPVVPDRVIFNDPAALDLLRQCDDQHPAVKFSEELSDKYNFRKKCEVLNPKLKFHAMESDVFFSSDNSPIGYPCVIKPVKGISSIGVHKCLSQADWLTSVNHLKNTFSEPLSGFKKSAVDTDRFMIESLIDGEEYAIDAYFDQDGKAVILSCYHHLFSDEYDISDQLYCINKETLEISLDKIKSSLTEISNLFGLKNFAVHTELRIDDGDVQFIEVNPSRFSGTDSPKLVHHFCGINPFEYFFQNKTPDWNTLLHNMDNSTYSFLFMCNVHQKTHDETTVDVNNLSTNFSNLLEYTIHQKRDSPIMKAFFFIRSVSFGEVVKLSKLNTEPYIKRCN